MIACGIDNVNLLITFYNCYALSCGIYLLREINSLIFLLVLNVNILILLKLILIILNFMIESGV